MENPHALKHKELAPKDLRWKCDPSRFDFDSTENIEPVEGIVGQDRRKPKFHNLNRLQAGGEMFIQF